MARRKSSKFTAKRKFSKFTLDQMALNTDAGRKKRSGGMRVYVKKVKLIRRTKIPTRPRIYIRFTFSVRGILDDYVTRIEFRYLGTRRVNWIATLPAKAYCSCPDFKYRFAYVHKTNKSLVFSPKLGLATKLPPKITNPKMKPKVCKHILASIRKVQRINKEKLFILVFEDLVSKLSV